MFYEFVKSFHLFITIIASIYIFIFPKKYDLFYMIYILLIYIQWKYFNGECLTSYLEKKVHHNGYTLGSFPYQHKFIEDTYVSFKTFFVILIAINILIVGYRSFNNPYIRFIIFLIVFIYFITFNKKYHHYLLH